MDELAKILRDFIGEARTRSKNRVISCIIITILVFNLKPILIFGFSEKNTSSCEVMFDSFSRNFMSLPMWFTVIVFALLYLYIFPLLSQLVSITKWKWFERQLAAKENEAAKEKAKHRSEVVLLLNKASAIEDLNVKLLNMQEKYDALASQNELANAELIRFQSDESVDAVKVYKAKPPLKVGEYGHNSRKNAYIMFEEYVDIPGLKNSDIRIEFERNNTLTEISELVSKLKDSGFTFVVQRNPK